jgi:very-short-patch-repair endonuclease
MNSELWRRWAREADEDAWARIREDGECEDRWIPAGAIPCESPIERQLAWYLIPHAIRHGFTAVEQFKLGRYRYDFAILWDGNVVGLVECDGAEFHSTPQQQARDVAKDLLAEQSGLPIFRYRGRDIHRNAWKCAEEIIFQLWGRR